MWIAIAFAGVSCYFGCVLRLLFCDLLTTGFCGCAGLWLVGFFACIGCGFAYCLVRWVFLGGFCLVGLFGSVVWCWWGISGVCFVEFWFWCDLYLGFWVLLWSCWCCCGLLLCVCWVVCLCWLGGLCRFPVLFDLGLDSWLGCGYLRLGLVLVCWVVWVVVMCCLLMGRGLAGLVWVWVSYVSVGLLIAVFRCLLGDLVW